MCRGNTIPESITIPYFSSLQPIYIPNGGVLLLEKQSRCELLEGVVCSKSIGGATLRGEMENSNRAHYSKIVAPTN